MAHGIRPGKWRTWADCVHPPQLRARFSRSGIRYRCLSTAPGQVKSLWERDFCVKCDGAHFGVRFLGTLGTRIPDRRSSPDHFWDGGKKHPARRTSGRQVKHFSGGDSFRKTLWQNPGAAACPITPGAPAGCNKRHPTELPHLTLKSRPPSDPDFGTFRFRSGPVRMASAN